MSDYLRAFNDGFIQGYEQMAHSDRILAFGAIRRAAEVARQHEAVAEEWNRILPPDVVSCSAVDSKRVTTERDREQMLANATRNAIRAAIGSDKA